MRVLLGKLVKRKKIKRNEAKSQREVRIVSLIERGGLPFQFQPAPAFNPQRDGRVNDGR